MIKDCYEIILNHNCDLHCSFCSQSNFKRSALMTVAEVMRHIYAAKKAGYKRIGFSGGEALLREELPALVSGAEKAGFDIIRLQTNGVKLANNDLCKKLVSRGLSVCKFTFLSDSPALHDRLVGSPGAFIKSLAGLDNMLALKILTGVNIPVMKLNYKRLKQITKFYMDRGVTEITIIYPVLTGAMDKNRKLNAISMTQAANFINAALNFGIAAGLGRGIKALNVPPCLLPGNETSGIALNKFNTVVADPLGGITDLDSDMSANKKQGGPCKKCFFRARCLGLDRRYLDIYGWKEIIAARQPVKKNPSEINQGYLNSLEKCFMEILEKKSPVSTENILKLAKSLPLCHNCKDGAAVLVTGETLIKKGLISKKLITGRYLWKKR